MRQDSDGQPFLERLDVDQFEPAREDVRMRSEPDGEPQLRRLGEPQRSAAQAQLHVVRKDGIREPQFRILDIDGSEPAQAYVFCLFQSRDCESRLLDLSVLQCSAAQEEMYDLYFGMVF